MNVDKADYINSTLQKLNNLLGTEIIRSDLNNIYLGREGEAKQRINIEFISYLKKQEVFEHVKNLKGTGVVIVNDLSYEERKVQKILKAHLSKAKKQNLKAKIKGNKLEIDGVLHAIDDLKRLEEELCSQSSSENTDACLQEDTTKNKKKEENSREKGQVKYNSINRCNLRSSNKK